MLSKWRYRSPRTFFGLADEYMQGVYETFFFLKYSGGWAFSEAYNLPIGLRNWFVERLAKQIEAENAAIKDAQSGRSDAQTLTPHNQPQRPIKMFENKRQD